MGISWWDRNPSLVIYPKVNFLNYTREKDSIEKLYKKFFEELSKYFENLGSKVFIYDEQNPEFKEGLELPFGVILNPVFLGELPRSVTESSIKSDEEFFNILREEIPEVYPPFAISIGRDLLKISPLPHPNFINVIFINDKENFIINMPYERKITFFRMLMAKIGAFKNIIILPSGYILSSLEGGCPLLKEIEELGKRLRVFGSAKEVGGYLKTDKKIPYEKWINSSAVNSIIEIGKFLGEEKLLSPPVSINSLLKNDKLAKFITTILSYSRQAEGAFMAYDPSLKIFVVTASGKYNVDKANLSFKDLVPILPTSSGKVEVFSIENIEVKGPSVEAEEFTLPLEEVSSEVPPIIGIIHIHRGIEYYDSKEIIEIPQDLETYPPVGCGVDLMHAMSKYAIFHAIEKKKENPLAKIAIFSVPNHGTNIYSFYEDNTLDSFFYVKKFIKEGRLKFRFDVPQV